MMDLPTFNVSEEYDRAIMHIRKAQESLARLAHLHADESKAKAVGFLEMSEKMKQFAGGVMLLKMGKTPSGWRM